MCKTYGPPTLDVRIVPDDEPFDWGDIDPSWGDLSDVENNGVWGIIAAVTMPACVCCGAKATHEWSVWNYSGDAAYLEGEARAVADEAMAVAGWN
jgi:hypothetical protein